MTNYSIDRRTALYGAAVAAAGATLAACSSAGTTAAAASSTASSDPANSTVEANAIGDVAPAPTSAAAVSGAAAAENGLGSAAAVKVGGGVIFEAAKIVVTQPTAGSYKAFTAVCTHQGCIVASVANGAITCPCHGSSYSIKDGSVINGPATAPLAEAKVTVSGGTIKLG
ncbi:Rieske (2Fe-2S) protein [Nakamurella sp. PAMC28650]|uniref:Rieske (2Fe-2S) protein n=1 Tax=Nakamurella sp. PAMC28650 TaxID=2762325 RepID=UPI00164E6164|nr:Rieske (2Fe-2S) protein [Nakamurella sp. PAMC28650]QNK81701.1 Rieske (2Fe-2S) protein [Nakamurella sp. PAMC28650]